MTNYEDGKIYIIKSNKTDDVYVGSTCKKLYIRMFSHISQYKRSLLDVKFRNCRSYKILKYSDAYIELIEDFPCKTKRELLDREGEITRQTPNHVNVIIQGRTNDQWRKDNTEHIKQYTKQYQEKNAEKIKISSKMTKEKYKEKYAAVRKLLYDKKNIDVECECKHYIKLGSKSGHINTQRHKIRMKLSEEDREKISGS